MNGGDEFDIIWRKVLNAKTPEAVSALVLTGFCSQVKTAIQKNFKDVRAARAVGLLLARQLVSDGWASTAMQPSHGSAIVEFNRLDTLLAVCNSLKNWLIFIEQSEHMSHAPLSTAGWLWAIANLATDRSNRIRIAYNAEILGTVVHAMTMEEHSENEEVQRQGCRVLKLAATLVPQSLPHNVPHVLEQCRQNFIVCQAMHAVLDAAFLSETDVGLKAVAYAALDRLLAVGAIAPKPSGGTASDGGGGSGDAGSGGSSSSSSSSEMPWDESQARETAEVIFTGIEFAATCWDSKDSDDAAIAARRELAVEVSWALMSMLDIAPAQKVQLRELNAHGILQEAADKLALVPGVLPREKEVVQRALDRLAAAD